MAKQVDSVNYFPSIMLNPEFFHIEERPVNSYNGADFNWDSVGYIPNCRKRYINHSTRTFLIGNSVILTSRICCARDETSPPLLFDELEHAFEPLGYAFDNDFVEGIDGFCYEIINQSQLRQIQGTDAKKPLMGACVLNYKNEKVLSHFEINMTVFSSTYDIERKVLGKDPPWFQAVKIKAFGVESLWFETLNNEVIVTSSSRLLQFVGLQINPVPEVHLLRIHDIKVELFRLTRHTKKSYAEKIVLLEQSCNVEVVVSKESPTELQSYLFDCDIPQIGFTFACIGVARFYVLKFTVKIEGLEPLTTYLEVKAASVNRELSFGPPRYIKSGADNLRHQLVHLEEMKREAFEPPKIADTLFNSMKCHNVSYVSHHTEVFSSTNLITTKTFVNWEAPEEVIYAWSKCHRTSVDVYRNSILNKIRDPKRTSIVVASYERTNADPCYVISENCKYPTMLPNMPFSFDYEGKADLQLLLLKGSPPVSVTLELTWATRYLLTLTLSLPYSWDKAECFGTGSAEEFFVIKIVAVDSLRCGIIREQNPAKFQRVFQRYDKIFDRPPPSKASWDSFTHKGEGEKVYLTIGNFLVDFCSCPTLVSSTGGRFYFYEVEVELIFSGGDTLNIVSYLSYEIPSNLVV